MALAYFQCVSATLDRGTGGVTVVFLPVPPPQPEPKPAPDEGTNETVDDTENESEMPPPEVVPPSIWSVLMGGSITLIIPAGYVSYIVGQVYPMEIAEVKPSEARPVGAADQT